jgi:hypothetical protein
MFHSDFCRFFTRQMGRDPITLKQLLTEWGIGMTKQQELYEAFLTRVEPQHRAFAAELHELFVNNGCTVEIKPTRSGFLVSYKFASTKKAVANFVFRKSGLLLRLYADRVSREEGLLSTLPEGMLAAIRKAPDCKRLALSGGCNPSCAAGYEVIIRGKRFQKCRYNAFLFPICTENNSFLQSIIECELTARAQAEA